MYDDNYPDGGRNDLVKTSSSLKECIEFFKNTTDEEHENKNQADIYDIEKDRWYSFYKTNIVVSTTKTILNFIPNPSDSEESLQKEKEVFAQLNSILPMEVSAYHLQTL